MNKSKTVGAVPGQRYGSVRVWCETRGMGKTRVYELLASGKLRAIKLGKSTLLDFEHGDAFLASLPAIHQNAA